MILILEKRRLITEIDQIVCDSECIIAYPSNNDLPICIADKKPFQDKSYMINIPGTSKIKYWYEASLEEKFDFIQDNLVKHGNIIRLAI